MFLAESKTDQLTDILRNLKENDEIFMLVIIVGAISFMIYIGISIYHKYHLQKNLRSINKRIGNLEGGIKAVKDFQDNNMYVTLSNVMIDELTDLDNVKEYEGALYNYFRNKMTTIIVHYNIIKEDFKSCGGTGKISNQQFKGSLLGNAKLEMNQLYNFPDEITEYARQQNEKDFVEFIRAVTLALDDSRNKGLDFIEVVKAHTIEFFRLNIRRIYRRFRQYEYLIEDNNSQYSQSQEQKENITIINKMTGGNEMNIQTQNVYGGNNQFADNIVNANPQVTYSMPAQELLKLVGSINKPASELQLVAADITKHEQTDNVEEKKNIVKRIKSYLVNHKETIIKWVGLIGRVGAGLVLTHFGLKLTELEIDD